MRVQGIFLPAVPQPAAPRLRNAAGILDRTNAGAPDHKRWHRGLEHLQERDAPLLPRLY